MYVSNKILEHVSLLWSVYLRYEKKKNIMIALYSKILYHICIEKGNLTDHRPLLTQRIMLQTTIVSVQVLENGDEVT